MRAVSIARIAACLALAAGTPAQFANPGAYVSSPSAGNTSGFNLLFFGNSYTISSSNPAVHTPTYGGARGVPELVRQIAIAAGEAAPFVKNVYHLNRGLDYHLNPGNPSLGHIDEVALDGETWDFVVLQGFSTRSTEHPYTGNPRLHQENSRRMFDEVRAGSTNHTSQHPGVVPVLYQTWARHPDHWFYDTTSSRTSGHNIAIGISNWTGGALFADPAEMAAQVRTSYDETRLLIDAAVPGAATRIAPAGDAWEAASWGTGFANLYAGDFYHANSRGDLLTALTIYGTIYGDTDTSAIVASGALQPSLDAIGVTLSEATQLAGWADQVLLQRPVPQPPQWPPSAILVDFSDTAGPLVGAEQRPVVGRHYNTVTDLAAGGVVDCVDTENRLTGVSVQIVDGFAGETSAGANGGFIGATNLSGSLYDARAQRDSFFVGRGAGFDDVRALLEIRGLDPAARYDLRIHGSRESTAFPRIGHFSVPGATVTQDAAHNMNLVADLLDVAPDASGVVELEITNGGRDLGFAYLGVLEIRASARLSAGPAPAPGESLPLLFEAPAHAGEIAVTGISLGLGPTLYGPHLLRVDLDAFFVGSFGAANSALFTNFATVLDASGGARPELTFPALPGLRGLAIHTVSAVVDLAAPGAIAAVSNTWSMRYR